MHDGDDFESNAQDRGAPTWGKPCSETPRSASWQAFTHSLCAAELVLEWDESPCLDAMVWFSISLRPTRHTGTFMRRISDENNRCVG